MDLTKIDNIVFSGIRYGDAMDFCDAYIESADYDGREMTDKEVDSLNDQHPGFVYESLLNQIF